MHFDVVTNTRVKSFFLALEYKLPILQRYCTWKTSTENQPITTHHTVVNNQINLPFDQSACRTYIHRLVTQQLMEYAEKTDRRRIRRLIPSQIIVLYLNMVYTRSSDSNCGFIAKIRSSNDSILMTIPFKQDLRFYRHHNIIQVKPESMGFISLSINTKAVFC